MVSLAAARIRAHTGNFHLVWRTFAKALVHERIYPCTRDGVDSWEAYWDPIVDAGGVKYFKPEDNRYFEHGFPLPERGGMHSNGETIRVFMDDLFLCPDCGALHKETNHLPDVPWMHWMHGGKRRIDAVVMWQAVETRFEKPEFVPQLCGNRKQCHETVKNVRRRVRETEINERLRRWAEQRAEKVAKANAEEAARRAARLAVPQKVYVIGSGSYVKIGIARDVRKRVSMLQISSPVPLTVIKQWECDEAYEVERRLHKKYAEFKTSGEWFAMPESVLRDLVAMKAVKSDDLGLSRTPGACSCW